MLGWTIYVCFLGVAVILALPPNVRAARIIALGTTLCGLFLGLGKFWTGGAGLGELETITAVPWVPSLGLQYHLAADGISLTLVLLTGIASVAGVLFSWNIETRPKEYFALYLGLVGAVYGVFLSFDLFLLFVFYELAIIPKYFLIAIWGSTNREYAAMKLALYSFAGSALVFIALVAIYIQAGAKTMNLVELARHPFPYAFQVCVFPLVFLGFGVLAGIWPLHTWAPTGHVAAPTAASMLLAGVIMKLGAYGALRAGVALFPDGAERWRAFFSILALAGIVYGALVALVQKDFKFVIGYSSISHMGFVLLGILTLNETGLAGGVLQMFSHGIIAGLLFAVVGRMIYDRTHTRNFSDLESMSLRTRWPFAAGAFVLASLAGMGLPGFSGFVSELSILIGAWQTFPTFAAGAGAGILIGVGYTLRALQKSFFPPGRSSPGPADGADPISVPERAGTALLLLSTLAVGLYPRWLLDPILAALHSPFFEMSRKAGGW